MRIELTQDAPAPNTGFEDQETHQLPIRPQKTALTWNAALAIIAFADSLYQLNFFITQGN